MYHIHTHINVSVIFIRAYVCMRYSYTHKQVKYRQIDQATTIYILTRISSANAGRLEPSYNYIYSYTHKQVKYRQIDQATTTALDFIRKKPTIQACMHILQDLNEKEVRGMIVDLYIYVTYIHVYVTYIHVYILQDLILQDCIISTHTHVSVIFIRACVCMRYSYTHMYAHTTGS
jgi:hypothetical protein